jgi:hypothetical protein
MKIKIAKNLFLREIPVTPATMVDPERQVTANNHIWIFDRSGSMSGALSGLVDDMISKLPTLESGDTLSIGWFSGEGQNDFILKGHKIDGPKSIDDIAKILRKYAHTVGCTCFSEIISKTDQVIEDLAVMNPLFSFVFFSDGYPVVSDYQREILAINKAIDRIKAKLTSVLLVGYGAYYNKELMATMTSTLGGTLVHSANLSEYSNSLTEFLAEARENGGRVEVTIPGRAFKDLYFGINNKTVISYRPNDKGQFSFTVPRRGRSSYYMLVADDFETKETHITDVSAQRAVLAGALILTQRTKTDTALELLGATGDVALIDAVNNSFTNDEYGRAETLIRKAIASPKNRLTKGQNTSYLPKRDVYCLIDAMATLIGDDNVRFLPHSPNFKYNRIGVKTNPKPGTPKFTHAENPAIPVETLTWNDNKLNLSLTCKIPGTVELNDEAPKFGFQKTYPTFVWRSYSIVKDGSANVTDLPLIVGKDTFLELQKNGVIDSTTQWGADVPVILHLDRIPVMNRAIADGHTSAKDLALKAIEEIKGEFKVKALKKIKSALETAGAVDIASRPPMTKDQITYLEGFFINRNGFGPPEEEVAPTDKYTAKEFNIKVKGFSSIPKIEDVDEKKKKILEYQQNPKGREPKLTPSEELLEKSLAWIDKACGRSNLTKVNHTLVIVTDEMRRVRKDIQRTKFAILLGKRWFDEFDSRENCSMEVDGFTCSFELREVTVDI